VVCIFSCSWIVSLINGKTWSGPGAVRIAVTPVHRHILCSSLHYLATQNIYSFGCFWNYFCWQRRRYTYLLPRFYLKHKLLVINFCVIKEYWQYIQHPSTSPTQIKHILALLAPWIYCLRYRKCHLFFYSFPLRINILVFMNSVVCESSYP